MIHSEFYSVWTFLQETVWSEEQLADLQSRWSEIDPERDLLGALEMERAMEIHFSDQLFESDIRLGKILDLCWKVNLLDGPDEDPHSAKPFLRPIQPWFWRHVWREHDTVATVVGMSDFIN